MEVARAERDCMGFRRGRREVKTVTMTSPSVAVRRRGCALPTHPHCLRLTWLGRSEGGGGWEELQGWLGVGRLSRLEASFLGDRLQHRQDEGAGQLLRGGGRARAEPQAPAWLSG